ncbi:hypothetical protein FJU08_03570 [Martelella alba]|uniref:Uncharacterized protein n=1 Tax=Martelella alba TaxID=2590451 RepID=A0A506UCE6_9HYPH|nr:hypothetical protein [Martelella alba]TPW32103.1 hypothetical protein FJU08_03570 [Martelella alba]
MEQDLGGALGFGPGFGLAEKAKRDPAAGKAYADRPADIEGVDRGQQHVAANVIFAERVPEKAGQLSILFGDEHRRAVRPRNRSCDNAFDLFRLKGNVAKAAFKMRRVCQRDNRPDPGAALDL